MARPRKRNAPEIGIATSLMWVLGFYVIHWGEWARVGAVLLAALAVGFAGAAVRDLRPQPVPPSMAGLVARYRENGWRPRHWHPILCDVHDAHVHLTGPHGEPLILVDRPQTAAR